jgi:hypothetical protein
MPTLASIERQIAELTELVRSAMEMLRQPVQAERDPSIDGFCRRHGISRSTYHNLRRAGDGPVESAAGNRRREITAEDEQAWMESRRAKPGTVAGAAAMPLPLRLRRAHGAPGRSDSRPHPVIATRLLSLAARSGSAGSALRVSASL